MQYFVVVNDLEKSIEIDGEVVLPSTAVVVNKVPKFVNRLEGVKSYLVVNQVADVHNQVGGRSQEDQSVKSGADIGGLKLLEQSRVDPDKIIESIGEVANSISPMEFSSEISSEEEIMKRYQNKIKKGS